MQSKFSLSLLTTSLVLGLSANVFAAKVPEGTTLAENKKLRLIMVLSHQVLIHIKLRACRNRKLLISYLKDW